MSSLPRPRLTLPFRAQRRHGVTGGRRTLLGLLLVAALAPLSGGPARAQAVNPLCQSAPQGGTTLRLINGWSREAKVNLADGSALLLPAGAQKDVSLTQAAIISWSQKMDNGVYRLGEAPVQLSAGVQGYCYVLGDKPLSRRLPPDGASAGGGRLAPPVMPLPDDPRCQTLPAAEVSGKRIFRLINDSAWNVHLRSLSQGTVLVPAHGHKDILAPPQDGLRWSFVGWPNEIARRIDDEARCVIIDGAQGVVAPGETPLPPPGPRDPGPPPDPDAGKQDCTEAAFRQAVAAGEASGTVTLKGSCRYRLMTKDQGGAGATLTRTQRIEGNGAIVLREPSAPAFGLLDLSGAVAIDRLTLRGGQSDGWGGAILSRGDLVLTSVTLEDNHADGQGGAVACSGCAVTLRGVEARGNSAGGYGGAVYADRGAEIRESRFIANRSASLGGGILSAPLRIENSLFAQNRAEGGDGAAIYLGGKGGPDSRIISTTITDNDGNAASAIAAWSPLRLRNTLIANHETGIVAGVPGVDEDYTLFAGISFQTAGQPVTSGGHSLSVVEPRFEDPARLNYRPSRYSPAVDRGFAAEAPATDMDGRPRPYVMAGIRGLTPLADIGAYETEALPRPSLIITKIAPRWVQKDVATLYRLRVENAGRAPAEALAIVEILPPGATFVSASDGARYDAATRTLTWEAGSLDPGKSRVVSYMAGASHKLVSRDYWVASRNDPEAGHLGAETVTEVDSDMTHTLGFFPDPDGFAFANYNDSPPSDLTDDDLYQIFSSSACKSARRPCVLRAVVQEWRRTWLKNVEIGHCVGFSVASLEIFHDPLKAAHELDPRADMTFALAKPEARRAIARYATTQGTVPLNGSPYPKWGEESLDPSQVLSRLRENFADPKAKDRYIMNFSKPDGTAGHAVVPYAIKEIAGSGEVQVYIYDNNNPNDFTRTVIVDPVANTWRYVGQTSPDAVVEGYSGDAATKTLRLTSLGWATSFPRCLDPDCTDFPKPVKTRGLVGSAGGTDSEEAGEFEPYAAPERLTIALNGEGSMLITRRHDGARFGLDPNTGTWLTEIEGARQASRNFGPVRRVGPAFDLPHLPGAVYTALVHGLPPAGGGARPASLSVDWPGFALLLDDLALTDPATPAPVDPMGESGPALSLIIAPDRMDALLSAGPDWDQQPRLHLAISQPPAPEGAVAAEIPPDYMFAIGPFPLTAGGRIAFGYTPSQSLFGLESEAPLPSGIPVDISRLHEDGRVDHYAAKRDAPVFKPSSMVMRVGSVWSGSEAPPDQPPVDSPLTIAAVDGGSILTRMDTGKLTFAPAGKEGVAPAVFRLYDEMQTNWDSQRYLISLKGEAPDGDLLFLSVAPEGLRLIGRGELGPGSRFDLVSGLSGEGYSLAAFDFPGMFLIKQGEALVPATDDGTEAFRRAASFTLRPLPDE